jgi:hypothetical protein
METIIGKSIPNKFDLHFARNTSPSNATKLWSPIVDMMLPLAIQLESAFSRGRISNENVQKTVPNFTGVVASLATLQRQTFNEFAALTKLSAYTKPRGT